jgi:conjugal transfer mating pair stabilization protein TraG
MLAVKSYVAILIWIQLWPPLYAVLNYMASIYASYDLAAAADLGGGLKTLSLQTASTIYSSAISGEAVVGYLVISIPIIAWAALKRMENFGTALVGGLPGLQASTSAATAGAATGNVALGNVSMDQMQLAPNRTSSFMKTWQGDVSGNTISSNVLNGRTGISLLRNQGFASRVVSVRVSEQDVTEANRQADSARSEAISANTERSAMLADTFARGLAKYRSSRSTNGTTSSSFEQLGENLSRLDQITKGVSDRTGLTQAQVAQIAFGASGHVGVSTPFAGAQINANAGKSYQSSLTADQQKALGMLTSDELSAFKQFGDRVSRDSTLLSLIGSDSRETKEMSSRLATATSRSERADATFAERTALAERLSAARERGETISIDIAQDPHNVETFLRYAEQYGGNSASAFALFDAELARQGLRPNRFFSDGTALPTSFNDIGTDHQSFSASPYLNPDTAAIGRRDRQHVSDFDTAMPNSGSTQRASKVRRDVQEGGAAIRTQTGSATSEFDAKAEVVKTPDGTLATQRSLLKQTGKQVAGDAGVSVDETKQAVKDLLKAKR